MACLSAILFSEKIKGGKIASNNQIKDIPDEKMIAIKPFGKRERKCQKENLVSGFWWDETQPAARPITAL